VDGFVSRNLIMELKNALEIIRQIVKPKSSIEVGLNEALSCILAEDIFSDVNVPPFDRSSMDGYACKKSNLPGRLDVIEELAAGGFPKKHINDGECVRIMTGAPVPKGADTVVKIEDVEELEDGHINIPNMSDVNICMEATDIKKGDLILKAGTNISAVHIAILAGAGKCRVLVFEKPKVAILPTGDELVEPEFYPEGGQIRNSNGHQLLAQLNQMNLPVFYQGIVQDNKRALQTALNDALEIADVAIFSGGVSVGAYDYVPEIIAEAGFDIHIRKMKMKPGQHTLFASRNGKYILGVPGNPVSSFVQMEIVGKYLLYLLMGNEIKPVRFKVKLSENYHRKISERLELIPVVINDQGEIELLQYHGSAHIHALLVADMLMEVPIGIEEIKQGEESYVRQI